MTDNEYKNCPYCDEEIKAIAVKCRYCQSMVNGSSLQVPLNEQERALESMSEISTGDNKKSMNMNKLFIVIAVSIIVIAIVSLTIFNLINDRSSSGNDEETINFAGGTYTGQVVGGVPHGYGNWEHPSGDRHKGEYKDGKKHGHGTYTFAKGGWYEGEWKDDLPNGQGTANLGDGRIYKGEFKDGLRHGKGVYTSADGQINEGRWEYDEYVGD